MRYLDYINEYWQYNRLDPSSPLEGALYFALLNECNCQHWPTSFRVPPQFAKQTLGRSSKVFIEVRQRLVDKGFITYQRIDNIGYYSIVDRTQSAPSSPDDGNTPKGNKKGNKKGDNEGNSIRNSKRNKNAKDTYYIEDKDKDKDISLSLEKQNSKDTQKENEIYKTSDSVANHYGNDASGRRHEEPKFNLPAPESTFRECRRVAKSPEYSKFLDFLEKSAPYVASHLITLSEEQFFILREAFGTTLIGRVVTNLENRRDLCSRYSHMYYTIKNWCINEQKRPTIA